MAELDRLRGLVAINRAIASGLDDEEVLRRVVEQTAACVQADACALLVNGDDQATIGASVGVDEETARRFRSPMDERVSARLRELLGASCEGIFLSVPVVSHERLLGLLAACRRGPEPLRADEEFLLSALADQAAIALERGAHDRRVLRERERGQKALRIIAARARCILWYADVEDRGDRSLHWDLKLFDEESAQRFFPIHIPSGLSYVEAWYESRLPEDKARMDEYGDGETRAGRSYRQEFRCRRRDGEIRWLAEDVQIETLAPGRWRAVGVCTDITDRKRAEEALRESEESYRSLTEAITSVVWAADAEGRFVAPQPSWAEYTGQTWEEMRDFGWANALHLDDRERVRKLWEAACATKSLYQSEARLWHAASGSYRHSEARGVPILRPDGSVREWVGTCLDVEDRRRAMEAIERQREDLQSLIIQSPVPICVLKGPDLVYEMANAAYLEVAGGRDILGKPFLQALPELQGQGFDEVLRGVMRAGEPVVGREALIMMEREGHLQETYWTFIYSPLRDEEGAVNRVVALCDDVTERRRLVSELIEADRRKDEFLATLAHELRNPLAPLHTSVQLLRRQDAPSPELQRAVDVIDRQLQQLVRLVDDLLDVSRITLDKLELRKERITLAMVVQAAVEASQPLIEQRGHELTVSLPLEPVDLDADLTRLAQVFLNLLNNAAKYMERGGRIQLTVAREGGEVVVVRVKDAGMGIAAAMLPRVFEMFTQVDRSLERSQGGLGIGLTLVKRLVQMHGGSIEAHSEGPGRGSEFVVRLPVAVGSSPGARPASVEGKRSAPTSRRRILVVDDNQDAAETLAQLLELAGNDLRTAHDGVAALEAAGEFRPDVVLLDIGLPRMNGYEVAQRIREQPWGQGMVLVALTGWGQEEDRHRSREAGFDHHLIKPVELDALFKLLASPDD